MSKKVAVVLGTRPEAIKLAPVVRALRADPHFECITVATAQHRELLDQALELFQITPEFDLDVMSTDQSLAELTARLVAGIAELLKQLQPNLVLVQGDTTSAFAGALAAFYDQVPVGHVEAGLRTWNISSPWPEEANRQMTTRLATLHFAPTQQAQANLLREQVAAESITITGNTVIDALRHVLGRVNEAPPRIPGLTDESLASLGSDRMVLITCHRRENFGTPLASICRAIDRLARRFTTVRFVFPLHLNPSVRQPVEQHLGQSPANVHLIEPLSYLEFVAVMNRATMLLTDSGGVQEEAPSLGKPVLVLRDTTERPEAVEAGTAKLVGTDEEQIFDETARLLQDQAAYAAMVGAHNPYGDGQAAERIVEVCRAWL